MFGDPGQPHGEPGRELEAALVEELLQEQVVAGLERAAQADQRHVGVLGPVDRGEAGRPERTHALGVDARPGAQGEDAVVGQQHRRARLGAQGFQVA